ncbi:hypothetical protein [Calothrix sp. PCC 6303]|uniref:hypothetical protein n=1 Tax=Calothrix sp. PCC 6303 TaxID=1170562 RepID=UPI0005A1E019|nr:hypothetical protein [Calothrix sp. PCC 6303]
MLKRKLVNGSAMPNIQAKLGFNPNVIASRIIQYINSPSFSVNSMFGIYSHQKSYPQFSRFWEN